jgi:hypothetical protein
MIQFNDLFKLEDQVFKLPGLYFLWTLLFTANFISLLVDNSTGVHRDFNIISNIFSVIYGCVASVNNIFGNMLPSTMLLIAGPVHQYSYWLLFAYFGGEDVLTSSAVGVMNLISTIVVAIFSVDMIVKTWATSIYPLKYRNYVLENTM